LYNIKTDKMKKTSEENIEEIQNKLSRLSSTTYLSRAILDDYAEVVSKIENCSKEDIILRIERKVTDISKEDIEKELDEQLKNI
jgi:hypothetical protein